MELSFQRILITGVLLLLIRFIYRFFIRPYMMLQGLKKVKGAFTLFKPLFGNFIQYQKDLSEKDDFFYSTKKLLRENKNLRFLACPLMDNIIYEIYDPELIKEFTINHTKFEKDLRLYGIMPENVKTGVAFTEGEKWKYQRKMLSQIFHFEYMNGCIPVVNSICHSWVDKYCKGPRSIVDVNEAFVLFAGEVVFNIFFGEGSFNEVPDAEKIIMATRTMMEDMLLLAQSPLNLIFGHRFIHWKLGKLEREYVQKIKFVNESLYRALQPLKKKFNEEKEQGRTQKKPWKTLIELLVEEAPKSGMSEKEFEVETISEILTFFIAGIDTTSSALSIAQYILAKNPDIQEKLRDEITSSLKPDEVMNREHLNNLKYLNAFFKEILRHSGPAPLLLPRRAIQDVTLGDLKIKKDSSILISLIGQQYNSSSFNEPEKFKPSRWIEQVDEGTRDPYKATPFSIGSRRCIGEQLSIIESKAMLIELVRNFRITLKDPAYKLRLNYGLTYQSLGEMGIVFERL